MHALSPNIQIFLVVSVKVLLQSWINLKYLIVKPFAQSAVEPLVQCCWLTLACGPTCHYQQDLSATRMVIDWRAAAGILPVVWSERSYGCPGLCLPLYISPIQTSLFPAFSCQGGFSSFPLSRRFGSLQITVSCLVSHLGTRQPAGSVVLAHPCVPK